jgi:murein DD-endopeptidase MepM/ murein hydrolase activator NlpD
MTVLKAVIEPDNTYAVGIRSYGTYVKISHGTLIDGKPYWTTYAHLLASPPPNYAEGQQVAKRAKIGLSGNTGYSTGPHLHFEVRRDQDLKDYSICPYNSGVLTEVY